ncbi:non-specific serine,threonine protein kinase [Sarracenia purpurea var. burkii]
MWISRNGEKKEVVERLVAVAVDKDKGSPYALKWAIDNLLNRGQTVVLVHVNVKPRDSSHHSAPRFTQASIVSDENGSENGDPDTKDLFLPFRCFCTRKDIQSLNIVLENEDVAEALVEYVTQSAIEILVLGSASKNGFLRIFKATDIPGSVSKGVPDFCTVYVISKGKISSTRSASRPAPSVSPLRNQILYKVHIKQDQSETPRTSSIIAKAGAAKLPTEPPQHGMHTDMDFIKKGPNGKPYGEILSPKTDISFASSGRPSVDRTFPSVYDSFESSWSSRLSSCSDNHSSESLHLGRKSIETITPPEFSLFSRNSDKSSSSQTMEDVEAEMRKLKLELKQTMDMYSTACKEALTAKQKATDLQHWKMEEEQRLEEARQAEEVALVIVEKERAKSKAAIEHAEAAHRIAQLEAKNRINAEMKALKEAEEKNKVLQKLALSDVRYRKYTIEEIEVATNMFSESRKIGEGGYGPVYKCYLDHTKVAVKVLRPDAAQGRSQFQQEGRLEQKL